MAELITCRACQIYLPDNTARCPLCHRRLDLPRTVLVIAALLSAALSAVLYASPRIKIG